MQIVWRVFHLPSIISKQKINKNVLYNFDNNVETPVMESAQYKRAQCGERREKQPRFSPCTVPLLLRRPRLLAICHCVYTQQPSNCNLRNISYRCRRFSSRLQLWIWVCTKSCLWKSRSKNLVQFLLCSSSDNKETLASFYASVLAMQVSRGIPFIQFSRLKSLRITSR